MPRTLHHDLIPAIALANLKKREQAEFSKRQKEHDRSIGNMLRIWRVGQGVSLRAVARHCGFSAMYLSHVERGIRSANPRLITAYNRLGAAAKAKSCP